MSVNSSDAYFFLKEDVPHCFAAINVGPDDKSFMANACDLHICTLHIALAYWFYLFSTLP
jgi:hypothetical protein